MVLLFLHFYQQCMRVPFFPYPSQHLIGQSFNFRHSNGGIALSHCRYLHFLLWCWSVFMPSFAIHLSSFVNVICQIFCQFFIGLFIFTILSLESSFYVLDISPISHLSFANIFSHFVLSSQTLNSFFQKEKFLVWWSPVNFFFF